MPVKSYRCGERQYFFYVATSSSDQLHRASSAYVYLNASQNAWYEE